MHDPGCRFGNPGTKFSDGCLWSFPDLSRSWCYHEFQFSGTSLDIPWTSVLSSHKVKCISDLSVRGDVSIGIAYKFSSQRQAEHLISELPTSPPPPLVLTHISHHEVGSFAKDSRVCSFSDLQACAWIWIWILIPPLGANRYGKYQYCLQMKFFFFLGKKILKEDSSYCAKRKKNYVSKCS